MLSRITAVTVSAALALAGPALAGESAKVSITSVKGAVSVSQDGRLAPARTGALRAGDRVIARDGEASLAYADGCVVTLKAQSMATIGEVSPCAASEGLVNAAGGSSAQMWGDATPFQMVMGILAVGGLLYGIGSLIHNAQDDDEPVSP